MKRRILAWVLALSLLISVLPLNVFAAEAGTEVLPAAIGDTTITLWTYPIGGWGGSQDLDQLIAGFTEENPGITVQVEHLDYMTGDSRVNEAIASGTTPDLILEGPERLVADWGARGVMADLSGLLDDEDRQEIYPEALKAGYGKDGKLYQYPLCGMVHTMAINKTVFEAAGAMQYINQDTRTWKSTEDFFKAVQAVYDDTNMTVGNIYCGGRGGDQGTRALVNNLYGGTYTDAAHTRYTWDSEANQAALNALCNCAGLEFNSQMVGGNEIAMLRNGTLNMAFCWNIAQQNMSGVTENGDEIMFLAFPSDDTPRLASGLWGFGAFDNGDAARLEAAKTFILYMCDSEATADAVRTSGYFAVRDTAAGNDLTDIWADDPVMDAYAGLMPMLGDYYVVTPNWGAARDCWWQMLQDVGHGRDIAEATAYWTGTANGTYSEKTELTVIAAMYSGDTASWWGQFEADFEMAHSDVDLIVDVYDWGSIYSEVNTRIQTGQAPDILNIDGYENYLGMLLPVPAYMSWETYSKFYPEFLAQSEMDGQIWAVPDIASTRGLYYNADLLGEIGLEVPTTFGELMEVCEAIKKAYGDDVIPWGLDVSANDAQSAFALYTWAAGGGFLDESGYWALNSESNKEVLYYAVALYENGYTNGTDLTSYDLREMFANGQVAMTVAPDSFRAWLDAVPGMNYGVANIIGNGMDPSHSIGVMDRIMCFDNNYSPEELAAVTAFFDFFYEDVRYANWARMEGFLPATSGGMDYLAETDPDMAVWGDILENARFYPANKAEWWNVRNGIVDVFERTLAGEDPGQLLDQLQAQLPSAPNPNADLTIWVDSSELDWARQQLESFLEINPQWADLVFDIGVRSSIDAVDQIISDPRNGADVYTFANDYLYRLLETGGLMALDEAYTAEALSSISPQMMATVMDVQGNYYGIPMAGNTWFMYYNKDIFSEADITSLEAMLSKGKVTFPLTNSWYLASFYLAGGGTMFGPNGNDASAGIRFGGEQGTAVTKYLVELVNNPNFMNDSDGSGCEAFLNGEAGAYFSGSWDYWNLSDTLGDSLGMAQLPTIRLNGEEKQLRSFLGSISLGVNPYTEHADVAQALVAFLASADGQKAHYNFTGNAPAIGSLASDPQIAEDELTVALINTYTNTSFVQPAIQEMANYWGPGGTMGIDLVSGAVTLENAAARTEQFVEQINSNQGSQPDYPDVPDVPDIPDQPENPDLKLWVAQDEVWWANDRLADFAEAYPQWADLVIGIEIVPAGDSFAYMDRDPEQGADVYAFVNDQLNSLREYGYIAPLDQGTADWIAGDYSRMVVNSISGPDGELYGVPYSPNTWFLYYNKNIFSEEDVASLETMLSKGKVAFELTNSWYLPSFFVANGGTIFGENNVDADAGVQFGGNRGLEVTQYLLQLLENDNFVVDGNGTGNAGLKDGSIGAYFSGYWDYAGLYAALGDSLGAAPAPTVNIGGEDKQMSPYAGTKAFGVNPNSEYPEAAQALAAFLASEESQLLALRQSGIMPIHPDLAEEATVASHVAAAAQLKTMEIATMQPTIPEMARVWWPMGNFGQELASGEITMENSAEKTAMLYINLNDRYVSGVLAAGTCGENLTWAVDFSNILYVFGTGAMDDYAPCEPGQQITTAPWGDQTFYTVILDNGITTIGDHAFRFTDVNDLTLPDTLVSIGNGAFECAESLWQMTLPEGLETIGNGAFCATGIRDVTIPSSVDTIGEGAFSACSGLEYIKFLGDAPSIGSYAFNRVSTDAYYPMNNATWTDDMLQDYGGDLNWSPHGIIGSGWSGYTTWTMDADGTLTFSGEGAMKNYTYKSEMPWYRYADQIKRVIINEGVTSIGNYAFYGMALESIEIPETVTVIGEFAFKNATDLREVYMPSKLTKLGESAFYGCTSLDFIDIPASLWTIQPYTFKNCINLEYVWFQEGNLQKISDGAFYGTGLTELYLPDCLDILDVYAFKNCPKLAYIQIGSGLTELREAVFYGTAITEITIPEGITKIGPYAFKNCVNLEAVELPQSLTSVGEAAFYADTALKTVELPDGVTTIGNYAFRKCEAIENLTLSAELVTVGECAFYGCTSLTELVIPDKVTTIMPYAFKTCTGLTSVTLGKKVTSIGEGAFNTCTGLKTIVFPASLKTIGDYCFSGSYNLWKLTFQGNAPAIGIGAFKGLAATAYYPAGNATWTSTVMQNYGGKITWKAN